LTTQKKETVMDHKKLVRISKFMSRILRHAPEDLGLTLEPGGWVPVADLLAGAARVGFPITREQLDEVVADSDKQRFAFDETGERIRANQGHSTSVDLQLEPVVPPDRLYHGTARDTVTTILANGLKRMSRHHVHLSETTATARTVGGRHGSPVVLVVDAGAMHRAGMIFYRSANGVWLTDAVPPEYLRVS
jgi:putative RNA 2'-phosphotransferase